VPGTSSRWCTTASSTPTCSSSVRPTSCCSTAWAVGAGDRRRVHRVERRGSGQLPGRDHRELLRQVDAKTGKPLSTSSSTRPNRRAPAADGQVGAGPRVPETGIAEAVFARALSGSVAQRKATTGLAPGSSATSQRRKGFSSRTCARRCTPPRSSPTRRASTIPGRLGRVRLERPPGDLATIWARRCIIRAKFLNRIKEAFDASPSWPP
jgi:6-phosphogluconate dehydrogenase